MYGHPIARQLEGWWKKHGGNEGSPEWHKFLDKYQEYLEIKKKEWTSPHENIDDSGRKVYGMSSAGSCSRAASLKLLGAPRDVLSGATQVTFFLGHSIEVMALASMDVLGYASNGTQNECTLEGVVNGKPEVVFRSKSDGEFKLIGTDTILSVKSTAYKMSAQVKGKFVRRGFPELPFEGVRKAHPSAYLQIQLEMAARGFSQGMFLYVSKDVVKAFENDEYVGEKGNGSLVFYAEVVGKDDEIVEQYIDIYSKQLELARNKSSAGDPMYPHKYTMAPVLLNKASYTPSNIWGGPNKELTGAFNPCGGCEVRGACASWT